MDRELPPGVAEADDCERRSGRDGIEFQLSRIRLANGSRAATQDRDLAGVIAREAIRQWRDDLR